MNQEKHFKYVILPELILLAATLLNVLMLFLNTSLQFLAFIIQLALVTGSVIWTVKGQNMPFVDDKVRLNHLYRLDFIGTVGLVYFILLIPTASSFMGEPSSIGLLDRTLFALPFGILICILGFIMIRLILSLKHPMHRISMGKLFYLRLYQVGFGAFTVFIMALHIELGKLQPDGWIYRDHPNQIVAIYIVITGGVLLLTELISWIVRYGSKLHQRNRKEAIE